MNEMKVAACTLLLAAFGAAAQDAPKADQFAPVRFLIGEWRGTVEGQVGNSTVTRSYAFVLADRLIEERNTSTYPAQDKNATGEVHEHRGDLSFDRKRKTLMMRRFHQESFVNLYAFDSAASTARRLVFNSEHIENFADSREARETYELLSPDEFVEIFELAAPGKPFETYSRTLFRRVR